MSSIGILATLGHGMTSTSTYKGVDILKNWQDIIKVRVKVMVERLLPSFLTYARTQTLNLCFGNKSFICKAKSLHMVSIVSKNPLVTWQSSHLSFKKCTIWTKISMPFLDI
jgi:hypothetical protein